MTTTWAPPIEDPVVAPRLPDGTSAAKLLAIGIDGLRWDRLAAAHAPNLMRLIATGLFAPGLLDLSSGAASDSAPGWSTLATGVWPDRHGVLDNSFAGKRYHEYPDFLSRLGAADPARSTFAALDWPPLSEEGTFGPGIAGRVVLDGETHGYLTEDARLADVSARVLAEQNPDAVFVYLGAVDIAGHGSGASSPDYTMTIEAVDAMVGQLVSAMRRRPGYPDERWLVLVGNDHGHTDEGGHGGATEAERRTFIIANGPGVLPGRRVTGSLVDFAPTALDHLGVRPEPAWKLAGRSLLVS
jgi:predicted AlkP superfamily pyrophosphatase or phosphodiesterase